MSDRHDQVELSSWNLFTLLDKNFMSSVRLACVFGNLGNEGLLVDENDEVYALGSNGAGCLGTGDMQSCLEPRKVESLCYKVSF